MSTDEFRLNPDKDIFESLAGDLTLIDAVKELVDNAIDNWTRVGDRANDVTITIDCEGDTTRIRDNTGGVKENEIPVLFTPAEKLEDSAKWSIGAYALGAKKAIPRLGGHGDGLYDYATIKSRRSDSEHGHGFQIDEDWFKKESWSVEKQSFEDLQHGATEIVVHTKEPLWNENRIVELKDELSKTYVKFLNQDATGQTGELTITVNGDEIQPARGTIEELEWSFLPIDGLYPRRYEGTHLEFSQLSEPIEMNVTVGLMQCPDSSLCGTDIYCQDRLVIEGNESRAGGYGTGYIDRLETRHERLKVIVELMTEGDASDLPWGNQKKSIDPELPITEEIHEELARYVNQYFKANTETVPTEVTAAYSTEGQYAANHGEIESVDVTTSDSVEKPSRYLSGISDVKDVAKYHSLKECIVAHDDYEPDQYEVVEPEEVPAYQALVKKQADDEEELEAVAPEKGQDIVDEVEELRKKLRRVRQLPSNAVDRIIDKGFLSVADVREANSHELKVYQVGLTLAERIKEKVEPQTSREEILQELSSLPTQDVDRVKERVAKLYKSLLHEFNHLPRERHRKKALDEDETLPLLAEDGEFYPANELFVPDGDNIHRAFRNTNDIVFSWAPKPERVDDTAKQIFKLLQRLGAESGADSCDVEVFGRNSIDEKNSTPRERLDSVWNAITSAARDDRDVPVVEWVEEAGTRYQLAGEEREVQPAEDSKYNPATSAKSCAYDPDENILYLTTKFTADWEALADVFGEALNASKRDIVDILDEAAPTLEDRAIDRIRQHESNNFDEVVDVRDRRTYEEYDVRGCDVFARRGDERRYIEVKARRSEDTAIRLIGDEPDTARQEGNEYYLYVVVLDEPGEEPRFWRLSNPAAYEYQVEDAWRINKGTWKESGEQVILD